MAPELHDALCLPLPVLRAGLPQKESLWWVSENAPEAFPGRFSCLPGPSETPVRQLKLSKAVHDAN